MGGVIGIFWVSMKRDILTPFSPIRFFRCGLASEDLIYAIAVVKVDVDDDTFESSNLINMTEGVRGTDHDIVEVAVATTKTGRCVMSWGTDESKGCS